MKKLPIALLISLTCLVSVRAATLSDIRTKVRVNIRDTNTADPRHSNSVIDAIINEANDNIVADARMLQKTTSYTLSPNTTYYRLPVDFLQPAVVTFLYQNSNNIVTLKERSLSEIYLSIPNWEYGSPGTPAWYLISMDTSPVVTSSSTRLISYIPIPDTTSTGTVTIRYYLAAPVMQNDGDFPFAGFTNLFPYVDAIVFYTSARLLAIDGIYDESKYYFDLYTMMDNELLSSAASSPNYHPGAAAQTKP